MTQDADSERSMSSGRKALRGLGYEEQQQCLVPAPSVDTASFERWVQSGLNASIGADLAIDGSLRGPTRLAVRDFQGQARRLVGRRLQVDGIAGPRTTGALELATSTEAPTIREHERKAVEGAREDDPEAAATPNAAPHERTSDAEDVVTDDVVAGELKGVIAATASKRSDTKVDMAKAYAEAKAWTMARLDNRKDDALAKAAHARLTAKHGSAKAKYDAWIEQGRPKPKRGRPPRDPGPQAAYIRRRWFRAYWYRKCYQFAEKMQRFIGGKGYPSLFKLRRATADAAANGEADLVQGRTTLYRGQTLAELAAAEATAPRLAPGTSVHVKLHWEGDNPYEYSEDFHHWVVYVGDGKFSDTLTGKDKAGAAHDAVLQRWVRSAFKAKAYKYMHADPRFVKGAKRDGTPIPKAGLQPRVSAEYDPRQAVTQRKG